MSNFIRLISVLLIILFFISSSCFATDIDMNIIAGDSITSTDNTINSNLSEDNSNVDTNRISSNNFNSSSNQSTIVKSVTETSTDDGLSLSNILNILLIAVGVVLILLAIAILIRLYS